MTRPDIKACVLIETQADETEQQFREYVIELLAQIYGKIPQWLEFRVGRRIAWRQAQFREFLCVAGSVSALVIQRAGRASGISRAIITYRSSLDAGPVAREIRGGAETELDPKELQVV